MENLTDEQKQRISEKVAKLEALMESIGKQLQELNTIANFQFHYDPAEELIDFLIDQGVIDRETYVDFRIGRLENVKKQVNDALMQAKALHRRQSAEVDQAMKGIVVPPEKKLIVPPSARRHKEN